MGRPTNNPKPYQASTRLDEETFNVLQEYCKQEHIPQNEGVRRGIKKLKEDIKK